MYTYIYIYINSNPQKNRTGSMYRQLGFSQSHGTVIPKNPSGPMIWVPLARSMSKETEGFAKKLVSEHVDLKMVDEELIRTGPISKTIGLILYAVQFFMLDYQSNDHWKIFEN